MRKGWLGAEHGEGEGQYERGTESSRGPALGVLWTSAGEFGLYSQGNGDPVVLVRNACVAEN